MISLYTPYQHHFVHLNLMSELCVHCIISATVFVLYHKTDTASFVGLGWKIQGGNSVNAVKTGLGGTAWFRSMCTQNITKMWSNFSLNEISHHQKVCQCKIKWNKCGTRLSHCMWGQIGRGGVGLISGLNGDLSTFLLVSLKTLQTNICRKTWMGGFQK